MARYPARKIGYWYLVSTEPLLGKHARWRTQAVALGLSKEARKRLEWFIWYEIHTENTAKTARHFGISRQCFHEWKKRFDGVNLRTLESKSCAPKHVRQKEVTPEEEGRIIVLRKAHIRWGKEKITVLYKKTYGRSISSWKIQYTIRKHNLYFHPRKNTQTQIKRRRSKEKKRITTLQKKPFPGYLIALDTVVRWIGGQKRYIFTAIDTASKIAFARMYTTKSSRNAGDFLNRFAYLLDYELWNVGHDNGSEFKKDFQKQIDNLKLSDWWSRVRTPTDNPFNESFNRTLDREFLQLGNLTDDVDRFNKTLLSWLIEYNFERPHQSLGYDTPWEYYSKAARVSPRYSSNAYNFPSI
jgi:transposase InsO family protein